VEHDGILRLLAEGISIDVFTKITKKRPASQREYMLSPSELLQVVNDKGSLIALYIMECSNVIVSVETAEVVESPSTAPSLSTVSSVTAPARTESPSTLPSSTLPSSRPSTSAVPLLSWGSSSNPSASMSLSSPPSPTGQLSVAGSEANASNSNNPSSSPSATFSSRSESIGDVTDHPTFQLQLHLTKYRQTLQAALVAFTTLIAASKLVMNVSCILWLFF